MPATPARSLRVAAFRGAPVELKIQFDHRRRLTLVYGENGSGKTTLCDAYDFLANGKVGSLADRGLGQLHPFWPTAGKPAANVVVELTLDGRTWTARAKAREVVVTPGDVPRPRVKLLRRTSLAEFVNADAKNRYEALRPFIDLGPVERAEQALRDQLRTSQTRLDQAATQIGENRETLRRMVVEYGAAGADPVALARAVTLAPAVDSSAATFALQQAQRKIDAAILAVEATAVATRASAEAAAAVAQAQRRLEEGQQHALTADATLVVLLEAAREHLERHPAPPTICPLCESPERAQDLAGRVAARIAAAEHVRRLVTNANQADAQQRAIAAVRSDAFRKARAAIEAALAAARNAPADWRVAHDAATRSLEVALQSSDDALALDAATLRAASDDAATRRASLDSEATRLGQIKLALAQHDENIARQATLSMVLPRMERALAVCERQRKQYLEQVLGEIAVEVGRLYEMVHPGEGLNKIAFKLSPTRRGSLDLAAEFLGTPDLPPQAYFSDSHLDTLGLCIFVALATREVPGDTIVVLDDVLGSMDEPHVDRLIAMLYEESLKFRHTLLTTHYRPWREKFRWGWLRNDQCEFIELGPWSPGGGIVHGGNSLSPLAELRQHLAAQPPALQPACAAAGVMLERACDFLVDLYELDVPRKRAGLTLADLLPRVAEKRLAGALRLEVRQVDGTYVDFPLGERLVNLRDTMQLRNVFGAHYNKLADELPPQDAIAFAQGVVELMDALVCDEHGWPRSKKSGSHWSTAGDTRRLHPLVKPQ